MTTPHGEIQGLLAVAERNVPACDSFAKAPSEPTVNSISVGGWWALDLRHRLVHQALDTLALLPKGTIYLGTAKHYSVLKVLNKLLVVYRIRRSLSKYQQGCLYPHC